MIVESEVALEVGADGRSIVALFPALEIADEPDLDMEIEQILAGNIFHRAVAFGPRVETQEPGAARILVNGEVQHTVPAEETGERLEAMVEAVAARLADAGEELRAGRPDHHRASSPRRTRPSPATRCGSSSRHWAAWSSRFS